MFLCKMFKYFIYKTYASLGLSKKRKEESDRYTHLVDDVQDF